MWPYIQQGRELFSLQVSNLLAILSIIHNAPSETALSMIVAFFVVAAFIPVIIQIIMSASSLPNRLGAVAIAEISRPGVNLSHVLSIHLLPMSKRRLNSP
jgi:hypothetical protein